MERGKMDIGSGCELRKFYRVGGQGSTPVTPPVTVAEPLHLHLDTILQDDRLLEHAGAEQGAEVPQHLQTIGGGGNNAELKFGGVHRVGVGCFGILQGQASERKGILNPIHQAVTGSGTAVGSILSGSGSSVGILIPSPLATQRVDGVERTHATSTDSNVTAGNV